MVNEELFDKFKLVIYDKLIAPFVKFCQERNVEKFIYINVYYGAPYIIEYDQLIIEVYFARKINEEDDGFSITYKFYYNFELGESNDVKVVMHSDFAKCATGNCGVIRDDQELSFSPGNLEKLNEALDDDLRQAILLTKEYIFSCKLNESF